MTANELSKKECFAGLAMQSLILDPINKFSTFADLAKTACQLADALLTELKK